MSWTTSKYENNQFMTSRAMGKSIKKDLASSNTRLNQSRTQTPLVDSPTDGQGPPTFALLNSPYVIPIQRHVNLSETGEPLPLGDPRLDAEYADNDDYQTLKAALHEWESIFAPTATARERAFYSSLRSMLTEGLRTHGAAHRREKFIAAHSWFRKNRPPVRSVNRAGVPVRHVPSPSFVKVNDLADFGSRASFFSVYSRGGPTPGGDLDGTGERANRRRIYSETPTSSLFGPLPPSRAASVPPGMGGVPGTPGLGPGTPGMKGNDTRRAVTSKAKRSSNYAATEEWESRPRKTSGALGDAASSGRTTAVMRRADPWRKPKSPRKPATPSPVFFDFEEDPEEDDVFSSDSMERLNFKADEDAMTHDELREKFRQSEGLTHHWLQDVHDTVTQWSFTRARTEEEITRRQEASRYTMPYPAPTYNPNDTQYPGHMREDEEYVSFVTEPGASLPPTRESRFSKASRDSRGSREGRPMHKARRMSPWDALSESEEETEEETEGELPIWLSPYALARKTGGKPDSHFPTRPSRQGHLRNARHRHAIADMEKVESLLEMRGTPVTRECLERALLIPPEKSRKDCLRHLPLPGSNLDPDPLAVWRAHFLRTRNRQLRARSKLAAKKAQRALQREKQDRMLRDASSSRSLRSNSSSRSKRSRRGKKGKSRRRRRRRRKGAGSEYGGSEAGTSVGSGRSSRSRKSSGGRRRRRRRHKKKKKGSSKTFSRSGSRRSLFSAGTSVSGYSDSYSSGSESDFTDGTDGTVGTNATGKSKRSARSARSAKSAKSSRRTDSKSMSKQSSSRSLQKRGSSRSLLSSKSMSKSPKKDKSHKLTKSKLSKMDSEAKGKDGAPVILKLTRQSLHQLSLG